MERSLWYTIYCESCRGGFTRVADKFWVSFSTVAERDTAAAAQAALGPPKAARRLRLAAAAQLRMVAERYTPTPGLKPGLRTPDYAILDSALGPRTPDSTSLDSVLGSALRIMQSRTPR